MRRISTWCLEGSKGQNSAPSEIDYCGVVMSRNPKCIVPFKDISLLVHAAFRSRVRSNADLTV
jgi:hypothetical protein